MKLQIIILLLILLSNSYSQGKKITGYILDINKHIPIEGANIYVTNSEIGTTSDSDGYFKISVNIKNDTDTLIVSFLGYESYHRIIREIDGLVTIYLKPVILELDKSISVIADKIDLTRHEVPHAMSVMNAEEIERIGSSEIGDVFKSIPSVRIEGNDLDGRTIQIRGSNADEVNVYIDGVLINNLRADQVADLTLVPTESIEKIEVMRGGNLILLGNGAFGGVVNLRTKKKFEKSFGVKVKGGSFKTKYILGNLHLPITDRITMNYFGQFNSSAPEIEFFSSERYVDKSQNQAIIAKKHNHHFNLNYFTDASQLNAKFIGYFFDYNKPGWNNRYDNLIFSGNYRGNIFEMKDFELMANYLIGDNSIIRDTGESEKHNLEYESRRINARFAKTFTSSRIDVQLLSEYYHDELVNTSQLIFNNIPKTVYFSEVYENRIAFASVFAFRDTLSSLHNLAVNTFVGLRYDILANGRSDFTNNFGIQLGITKNNWQINPYIHYGKNIKYPSLFENAFLRDLNDIFHSDTTTKRLEPEFNNSAEFGINLDYIPGSSFYQRSRFTVAIFRNTFYNILLSRPFDNLISAAQQGRNITNGIEASVRFEKIFYVMDISAFILNLDISDPFLYAYKPENSYSIQMDYNSVSGLYFRSAFFHEGRSTAWFYNEQDEFSTEFIAPFYDVDVSIGYRFRLAKILFDLQAAGYNVLDNSGYKYYTLKKRFIQVSLALLY